MHLAVTLFTHGDAMATAAALVEALQPHAPLASRRASAHKFASVLAASESGAPVQLGAAAAGRLVPALLALAAGAAAADVADVVATRCTLSCFANIHLIADFVLKSSEREAIARRVVEHTSDQRSEGDVAGQSTRSFALATAFNLCMEPSWLQAFVACGRARCAIALEVAAGDTPEDERYARGTLARIDAHIDSSAKDGKGCAISCCIGLLNRLVETLVC